MKKITLKNAPFWILISLYSASGFANEAVQFDCIPTDPGLAAELNVKIVTRFVPAPVISENIIVVTDKKLNKVFETPIQIQSSLDPEFTATRIRIPMAAVEEMGSVIIGKGGTYLYLRAPLEEETENLNLKFPTKFNSDAFRNGVSVPMVCEQLIVG